jgi:tetratricopeptide (TPR) repeat protein
MRQAYTPACLIFFCHLVWWDDIGKIWRCMQMVRDLAKVGFFTSLVFLSAASLVAAQQSKTTHPAGTTSVALTTAQAMSFAEQGRCKEAVPALKRAIAAQNPAGTRKSAGVLGLRCALAMDDRDSVVDFTRALSKQFPDDPDVLFVLVHAYSDLSTRVAEDLARTAPRSIPAHKLNAEALEMQGKWDQAQREYEDMIEKEPNTQGLHFLLGRALVSRPDADAKALDRAKQEFQKELEIDPKNAAAHYVLGELASKEENWDEAVTQFGAAAKLDTNFAEAFLGWGFALVTVKRYEEAIVPLRVAERLTPGNPAVHYTLGTALTRAGQQEEAEKEFAIHRSLTAAPQTLPGVEKPQ